MVGWAIVADLVVEFICMPRYNYTKKKKSQKKKKNQKMKQTQILTKQTQKTKQIQTQIQIQQNQKLTLQAETKQVINQKQEKLNK